MAWRRVTIAASQSQAPEIDSTTLVHGTDLHPGQMASVKVTGAEGYDLVAEVPMKRSRGLKVLRA